MLIKRFAITLGFILFAAEAPSLFSQSRLAFSVGGGTSIPIKETGRRFNSGFNLNLGLGIQPVRRFGLMSEFGYNNIGVNRAALDRIGVPNGRGRVYSATLNPMVHLTPDRSVDVYMVAGGGFYRRTIEFTEPSFGIATAYDPFYGAFYPVGVQTTTVLGSFTQNKGGINGGMGLAFKRGSEGRSAIFAESRYHHIFTTPIRTVLLPVTVGFRW